MWLECHGLPPHAWWILNLHKIGEVWGYVVGVDANTVNGNSFSVARVLTDTNFRHFIKGLIFLSLGDEGYDVYIKECGNEDAQGSCYQFNYVKSFVGER